MSVTIQTSLGSIKVELFCEKAPKACRNFLGLAASGSYNQSKIHRVIPAFVMQGGATSVNTKNDISIYNGTFEDEISEDLKLDKRGLLCMANKGPNTNLSQFFITFQKQPHLNNTCTIFGRVISGWSTLDAIEVTPTDKKNKPETTIFIENMTIHANPFAEKDI